MANSPNTMPAVFDTDFTSYRAIATDQTGIRIYKLILVPNGTSVAGTVQVSATNDSIPLYAPITVGAAATGTIVNDNITDLLDWDNFGVSGLTASSTKLFVWYRK